MKLQIINYKFRTPPLASPPYQGGEGEVSALKIRYKNKARQGISLLLTMSILGGLVLITGAASNLVITVSRSSRSIGDSEIAYFAAETAVERALLQFEKNGVPLGDLTTNSIALPSNSAATYTTSATMETKKPPDDIRLSVGDTASPITASNPLVVTLAQAQKLYLDLGTNGASYPNNVSLEITPGHSASIIVYASNAQSQDSCPPCPNNKVVVNNPGFVNGTRAKVENTNPDSTTNPITIKPTGSELPIGVLITGEGRYRGVLRRIEVFRPNYVIY